MWLTNGPMTLSNIEQLRTQKSHCGGRGSDGNNRFWVQLILLYLDSHNVYIYGTQYREFKSKNEGKPNRRMLR